MSRRDTIIVAVLINAGLLIVLFASALKSNFLSEEFVANSKPASQHTLDPVLKKETAFASGDEVDLALNQSTQHPIAAASSPPVSPLSSLQSLDSLQTSPPIASNFTEDLKAIAIPETQIPAARTLVMPIIPSNPSDPEYIEIKVKKGDVLEKIARYHHTTVAEIMKANQLTSSNLYIGQILKIPNKAIKKTNSSTIAFSPQGSSASHATHEGVKYYIVKKGDSPWTIAIKNRLKVEDLLKLNNMTEEQARRLKPGDQLRIQ
jgi:peptidoglycan endopeptidase LytF